MVTVPFKGKSVDVHLNMYTLRLFGKELGKETATEAFSMLDAAIASANRASFESQDIVAALFISMHRAACELKDQPEVMKKAEAYDIMLDADAFAFVLEEVANFLPEPETVKKKELITEELEAVK